MKNYLTVCFTGTRPKGLIANSPYNENNRETYKNISLAIYKTIEKLYDKGYRKFISGGAQGIDQLAFWAVHHLKEEHPDVINAVYIPFRGQEVRWAKYGLFSQKEYRQMLSLADEVQICTIDIDTTNFPSVVRALNYRNECMVNDSSLVIGHFKDDSWRKPTTKSGTANCLRYALNHGVPTDVHDFKNGKEF